MPDGNIYRFLWPRGSSCGLGLADARGPLDARGAWYSSLGLLPKADVSPGTSCQVMAFSPSWYFEYIGDAWVVRLLASLIFYVARVSLFATRGTSSTDQSILLLLATIQRAWNVILIISLFSCRLEQDCS